MRRISSIMWICCCAIAVTISSSFGVSGQASVDSIAMIGMPARIDRPVGVAQSSERSISMDVGLVGASRRDEEACEVKQA